MTVNAILAIIFNIFKVLFSNLGMEITEMTIPTVLDEPVWRVSIKGALDNIFKLSFWLNFICQGKNDH